MIKTNNNSCLIFQPQKSSLGSGSAFIFKTQDLDSPEFTTHSFIKTGIRIGMKWMRIRISETLLMVSKIKGKKDIHNIFAKFSSFLIIKYSSNLYTTCQVISDPDQTYEVITDPAIVSDPSGSGYRSGHHS